MMAQKAQPKIGKFRCSHCSSSNVKVIAGVMWTGRNFHSWNHEEARLSCNECHEASGLTLPQQIKVAKYVAAHPDLYVKDEVDEALNFLAKNGAGGN